MTSFDTQLFVLFVIMFAVLLSALRLRSRLKLVTIALSCVAMSIVAAVLAVEHLLPR